MPFTGNQEKAKDGGFLFSWIPGEGDSSSLDPWNPCWMLPPRRPNLARWHASVRTRRGCTPGPASVSGVLGCSGAAQRRPKEGGSGCCHLFGATYPLATLSLEAVEQAHVAYLNALLEADPGPSKSRVLLRLRLAAESADRLSRLVRLAPNSEYALPGCTTFISSCRDEPHGRRVVMSQKPREHPFPAGSFKGARPGARPHVLHFPKPSLPADDARNGGPRIPLSMWVPPCMGAEPPALAPRTLGASGG